VGLGSLVRNAVSTAHRITNASDGLQTEVTYRPWTGYNAEAKPTYGFAQTVPALVQYPKGGITRTVDGQVLHVTATVLMLELPTASTATGRRGRIDLRDEIVIGGRPASPIVGVEGVLDPSTGDPYMVEVSLG
jgi:hypothetical protein